MHELGYEASSRSKQYANLLIIGYKSKCCMEGPGLSQALTTSGAYDQLRISNVPRYVAAVDTLPTIDTTVVIDSLPGTDSTDP